MRIFGRLLPAAIAGAAIALSPAVARADQSHHFFAPGVLFGFGAKIDDDILGILGGEVDYTYYPDEVYLLGIGAYGQAYTVGFDHVRFSFGPQVNFAIGGLEAGISIEQEDKKHSTTVGAQLTPFVSIGLLSLGCKIGVPFYAAGPNKGYAVDVGMNITLKWPFPLNGDYIGRLF